MKGTAAALVAHMGGEVTTLASCVKIVRKDTTIFGFTDHDQPFPFEGVTYSAAQGTSVSAISTQSGLGVDNLELTGFLDAAGLTEADIEAGLWDYAAVTIFELNWADLTMGANKQRRGVLGEVTVEGNKIVAEVRGLAQWVDQIIIEAASKLCKADLFDSRCGLTAIEGSTMFSACGVSAVTDARRRFTVSDLNLAADFFTNGKVTFTSGANNGLSFEIKTHALVGSPADADLTLFAAMPYDVAVGDTVTVYAGCQKRFAEDCGTKFSNQANFRGFPHLPGDDDVYQTP